ncbi:SNF2-related protein [Paucibacter sp. Y2R2-4]|uniref:SNF2-related protein n=1 Tax=Paucibacter sp. Y2R2-4 TaxID=2893553 RepID=UPI0021E4409A|nr:SNF2-related protein [Paucibacter sp. Y2R2-4]MCV2348807.1 SNF2-related protein [Paucibacter sp. Y2R2-4]
MAEAAKPAAKKASAAKTSPARKTKTTQAAVRDILNGVELAADEAASAPAEAEKLKPAVAAKTIKPSKAGAAGKLKKPVATAPAFEPVVEVKRVQAPVPEQNSVQSANETKAAAKSPKERGTKARTPAPVAERAAKPEAARPVKPSAPAKAQAARFDLQPLDAGKPTVFRDYQVSELLGAGTWRVSVRGSNPSECRCSCEEFLWGERGSCEHIEFALGRLLDDAAQRALLEQGYQTEYSEIRLGYGARRHLRWRQGRACPEALVQAAQALLDGRGRLQVEADEDLPALLALAAEAGHELRVEPGVWDLLAIARDARRRVLRIEQACPQGLESPALRNLLKLPLPIYQVESAIFAACAGRSLIADDLGLGLYAQAYAAAALFHTQFGLERVLVLSAESAQARWLSEAQTLCTAPAEMIWGDAEARQQQCAVLPEGGPEIKIASLASLGQDLNLLKGFAPELIIVDEAQRLDTASLASLRQLDQGFMLMLSGQLLDEQPQALMPLLELLDRHRSGSLERFLNRHVVRDVQGRVSGFTALESLDKSLEQVMFSRSRADLQPTLPLALVQLRAVTLSEQQLELQAPLLERLRQGVARWQRSGYVSDADQLRLQALLQDMRRLAIAPQLLDAADTSADAPKLSAAAAVCRETLGRAVDRLVVFCQWDDALQLLAARLQAQGIAHLHLQADASQAQRQAAASQWLAQSRPMVLLCSDAAAQGLSLDAERCGLLNLELAWSETLLEQRLSCLAQEHSRGLPMIQLLTQSGLEQALLQTLDAHAEAPAAGLDGDLSQQLLQGEDLQRFMQLLQDLTQALAS